MAKRRNRKPNGSTALAAILVVAGVACTLHLAYRKSPMPIAVSDEEALARVIRSEIGVGTAQQKLHVAWVARNLAKSRNQSIQQMVCTPCGPQKLGRPLSTLQAATEPDRELARAILAASDLLDPTGGATHFMNPRLQDELASRKVAGYEGRGYRTVSRVWRDIYGWQPYYRLGDTLEIWGNAR